MSSLGHIRGLLSRRIFDREERRFEERYGIETGGIVEPTALSVPDGDPTLGFTYVSTPPRVARAWLRALPADVTAYTFVDLGSGKGRVLLLAAERGFARVVGVEFAEELHAIALENARSAREHGRDVEPVLGDAASFEFPLDPLVVHFNNPFKESVMSSVISRLSAGYAERPRPIVIVYQQQTVEEDRHRTRNIDLLAEVPYLSGRILAYRGLDRWLLDSFAIALFESPEVSAGLRS